MAYLKDNYIRSRYLHTGYLPGLGDDDTVGDHRYSPIIFANFDEGLTDTVDSDLADKVARVIAGITEEISALASEIIGGNEACLAVAAPQAFAVGGVVTDGVAVEVEHDEVR